MKKSDLNEINSTGKLTSFPVEILVKIYLIILKRCNIDFTHYKRNTILRSISKRMKIIHINDLNSYLLFLQQHAEEVDVLCSSFLISVTKFFRDKEAFDTIEEKIIPAIFNNKSNNSEVRFWVVGCSTGEEAFSLAMLLKNYMDSENKLLDVKIFATDIDKNAIEFARMAIYPQSIEKDVPALFLERYFTKKNDTYHIIRQIREMVVFSYHNIIYNPPFSRIDFISCRNLLIYFQKTLQQRVFSLFQYAIHNGGYLFLGTSESINKSLDNFKVIDSKWKIFNCIENSKRPFVNNISLNIDNIPKLSKVPENSLYRREEKSGVAISEIQKKLIEKYLRPSVIIDETNEIVQICGEVNKYLNIPIEKVSFDILKMVPKSLSTAISTALIKLKKNKKPIKYTDFKINVGNEVEQINLIIEHFDINANVPLYIIIFEKINLDNSMEEYSEEIFGINIENKYLERISVLEQELNFTREGLQNTLDEVAISGEELQSSNEELLVSNEELHSTNEELQSVNEESIIVNNQYQYTIQELTEMNDDMNNFLKSTEIGTLFLDKKLRVKKFTTEISKEINLIEQDIGRSFSHISHNLIDQDLINDSQQILDGIKIIKKEVQSKYGSWYLLKYSAYTSQNDEIQGVILSLINITLLKGFESSLRNDKERYRLLVESSPFAIIIVKNGIIVFANNAVIDLFGVKKKEDVIGRPLLDYLNNHSESLIHLFNLSEKSLSPERAILNNIGTSNDVNVEITSIPVSFEGVDSQLLFLNDIRPKLNVEKLQQDITNNHDTLNKRIADESLRNNFFSNISHEIKTPLNVIFCSIQLIEKYLNESTSVIQVSKIIKNNNIMKQNCYRLLRLINNFLDISKVNSGFLNLTLKSCDIVSIIREITMSVAEFIKEKSISLLFNTSVSEKILSCDPDNIERIILNLLSNAIKFNKQQGEIFVSIYDKGDNLAICIKDTGIGIPEDKLHRIFDRFIQLNNSLTKSEGTGIGLSLVKSLVELHEGVISVKSQVGVGTEFLIELPTKIIEENSYKCLNLFESGSDKIEKIKIEFSDIYSLK